MTSRQYEDELHAAGLIPELTGHLSGWTIRMPPLRERIEDLVATIEELSTKCLGMGLNRSFFSSAALQSLHAHLWPGNEAEVRSLVGALAGRPQGETVQPADLEPLLQHQGGQDMESRTEKDRIVDALWRHGFNRTRAAAALGISRKTLYNKIQRFGLSG